jgi:hypothetical protein
MEPDPCVEARALSAPDEQRVFDLTRTKQHQGQRQRRVELTGAF